MHEVITLQFGENANYLGTHFWNIQQANLSESEEVAVSVLYREGPSDRGKQQHTPRLLLFDNVGNFGSLGHEESASGGDEADQADALWSGQSEVYRQPLYPKSEFIKHSDTAGAESQGMDVDGASTTELRERDIRFWSDFSEMRYHSKSLHAVSGVEHGNSLGEMNTFHEGVNVFEGENSKEDVIEGDFRHFAEECDHIQGFQVLADAYGGFAGYSMAFISQIRDEYPKSSILLYSIGNTKAEAMDDARGMDASINFAANVDNVSMFVPMSVPSEIAKLYPNVELKENNFYQASAFMAMNIDLWSYSLLTRRRTLNELVSQVTQQEYYKLAESLLAPGLRVSSSGSFGELSGVLERDLVSSSAVSICDAGSIAGQFVADRGTSLSDLVSARSSPVAYAKFDSPVRLPRSFPKIFRGIDSKGFKTKLLDGQAVVAHGLQRPQSVCAGGLLCTTSASESYLQKLHGFVRSERSRHFKDYERELIREYKQTLDSAIDRYTGI
ncbi:tubulin nucleotide-binding domain-like protein [Martensiomyces pterosporus]|nr:tubulin nucleotide-binding domain-like protein [Martensiomyces pterosporus]